MLYNTAKTLNVLMIMNKSNVHTVIHKELNRCEHTALTAEIDCSFIYRWKTMFIFELILH